MALRDHVCIVTGAAGGIGKAVAESFAREKAKAIICVDINEELTKKLAENINGKGVKAVAECLNIGDEKSVVDCVARVKEQFGTVHVLVNNACLFVFGHLNPGDKNNNYESKPAASAKNKPIKTEEWLKSYQVNVIGHGVFTREVGKLMKDNPLIGEQYKTEAGYSIDTRYRGSIINMSSMSGYIAQETSIPYNTTKAAIIQMTRCCALDFWPYKIRVNSVCPGSVETPFRFKRLKFTADQRKQFDANLTQVMKRSAAPEEIANAVLFLASSQSSFMTGSSLNVDGGLSALCGH